MKRTWEAGILAAALFSALFFSGCATPFGYCAAGNKVESPVQTGDNSLAAAVSDVVFRAAPASGGSAVIVSGSPTEDRDQVVTLDTETPDALIYYCSTPGCTPNPNRSDTHLYRASKPFKVSGNNSELNITAVPLKALMLPSAVTGVDLTVSYTMASSPAFDKAAGVYGNTFTLTVSDTAPGATVYYTTDGSTPAVGGPSTNALTPPSTLAIGATTTVRAIAAAANYTNSSETQATYTLQPGAPTFSPGAGTYNTTQTVTTSSATDGSTIWYTTNGQTPDPLNDVGTQGLGTTVTVTVSATETLKAVAYVAGWTPTAVASAAYTLQATVPTFSVGAGTYNDPKTVELDDSTPGATIYYTVDGTTPVVGTSPSVSSGGTLTVESNETLQAVAALSGYTSSVVQSASYSFTDLVDLAYSDVKNFVDGGATTAQIDNSGSVPAISNGTIFLFKTDDGYYGKMEVTNNDEDGNDGWTIAYATFNSAGTGTIRDVASANVPGTLSFDLGGASGTYDFFLENIDSQTRYFVTENGAIFTIYYVNVIL
jgi:Chitobiase/beta-hexosaminidase C-terminal domain